MRDTAIRALREARRRIALTKGIIIADTKFEFGLDERGTLTLMDEVLTPDSSRFWPVGGLRAKARTRRATTSSSCATGSRAVRIDGEPWNKRPPAPPMPAEVVRKTAERYASALERLTGTTLAAR